MRLKTVELEGKTYAEVQDGKPIYLDGEKELPMDVPAMSDKITALGKEAKGHREAKEAAEKALKQFEGIEDPATAIKAIETMQNLDDKKLIDAGEVEKVKQAAIKAKDEEYKPYVEKAETLEKALRQEKIGGSFARSQFIADKLAMPVDFVEARFGQNFDLDEGKMVAKDNNGNPIYSKSKPGELADFDEALEIMVESYPHRDSILKGRGHSGSGAPGGGSGGNNSKTISRAEFDQINKSDPARAAKMVTADGIEVVD